MSAAPFWSGATRPCTTAPCGSWNGSWRWAALEVIPGISSVQALAARHRVPLNRIGEPIRITTGRRLLAEDLDNVVVMLDAHCAFGQFADQTLDIYWGAYLGTEDELLVSGKLQEVQGQIRESQGLDHGHLPAAPSAEFVG